MSTLHSELTQQFDKIYIINLAHRQDRRIEMQAELVKIGLSLEHPQVMLFTAVRPDSAAGWPSIGARGCFMSHLGVLQHAQQHGYGRILILEDDLNFVAQFNVKYHNLMRKINENSIKWDIFYGGYELEQPLLNEGSDFQFALFSLGIRTTHFIGFDQHVIPQLIDYLTTMMARVPGDPQGGPMHVDGAYSWYRKSHPEVVTVLATPSLGYQRSSQTDIHALGWKDRMPIIKQLVGWVRKIKNAHRANHL